MNPSVGHPLNCCKKSRFPQLNSQSKFIKQRRIIMNISCKNFESRASHAIYIEREEKKQKRKERERECLVMGEKRHCQSECCTKFLLQLILALILFLSPTLSLSHRSFDYRDALSKSLLYFEAQRSGRLPYNQRVSWRHHSGLTDGLEQGVRPSILSFFF